MLNLPILVDFPGPDLHEARRKKKDANSKKLSAPEKERRRLCTALNVEMRLPKAIVFVPSAEQSCRLPGLPAPIAVRK